MDGARAVQGQATVNRTNDKGNYRPSSYPTTPTWIRTEAQWLRDAAAIPIRRLDIDAGAVAFLLFGSGACGDSETKEENVQC